MALSQHQQARGLGDPDGFIPFGRCQRLRVLVASYQPGQPSCVTAPAPPTTTRRTAVILRVPLEQHGDSWPVAAGPSSGEIDDEC